MFSGPLVNRDMNKMMDETGRLEGTAGEDNALAFFEWVWNIVREAGAGGSSYHDFFSGVPVGLHEAFLADFHEVFLEDLRDEGDGGDVDSC